MKPFSQQQTGTTLIEILVTLLILSLGMMGLAGLQANAIKANLDASQQSQVMWVAQELPERMRANPNGLAQYVLDGTDYKFKGCPANPPSACGDRDGAPAAACDSSTLATFDVVEVFCGYDVSGVVTDSSDTVALDELDITTSVANTSSITGPQTYYTVTVTWISKQVTDLKAEAAAAGNVNTETEFQTLSYTFLP